MALVGKGITFDTGGYDIKDDESMSTMKSDMGGAAAVIGAVLAIARAGIKANVTAVVAACENRVSGNAYLPGDVLRTMSGKTVEVINTDAEGRLTLIDAVTYMTLGEIVRLLQTFHDQPQTLLLPEIPEGSFEKKRCV